MSHAVSFANIMRALHLIRLVAFFALSGCLAASAADRTKLKGGLRKLTARDLEAMLEFAPLPLESAEIDVAYVRRTLSALVRRIELDPDARTTQIQYSLGSGSE